jgi:hypothetical protein
MNWIRRGIVLAVLLGAVSASAVDTDSDGIPDSLDTCISDNRNGSSNRGCDHDTDGYGNVCDADFDQSGSVIASDFTDYFTPAFKGGDASPWPEGMDMDCSGAVISSDYTDYFAPSFKGAAVPGPSGAACAGHSANLCKPNLEARMVEFEQGGSGVDLVTTSFGFVVSQSEPLHPTVASTDPDDSESYLNNPAREATGVAISDPLLVANSSTALPFEWAVDVVRGRGTSATTSADWSYLTSTGFQVSEQTVCNRLYFSYSDGFADGNNSPADVVVWNGNNSLTAVDPAVQLRWDSGVLTLDKGLSSTNFGGSGSTALTGDGVARSECTGEFCRVEVCYDHDEDQDDTNKVRVRASVEVVTGASAGQRDEVNELLPNGSSTLSPAGAIGLQFTGTSGDRAWFDADEYIDLANYLSAQFNSVDTTYEIGPAYEIEGY